MDSSGLLGAGDLEALRSRFDKDGYLYLPGLIDRAKVLAAREKILKHMDQRQDLEPGYPVLHGVMPRGGRSVNLIGVTEITSNPTVAQALESSELFNFFLSFYREEALTFPFKWLRAVGNEKYTGAHYDVVYMGRGSRKVHTVWIPLGDIPVGHGTLAVCHGSHSEPGFRKLLETYGRMDVDRDNIEG